MKAEVIRYMWLMLFFDLPVGTKAQRTTAARFRQMLKTEGFMMLQFSVYARICRGEDGVDKFMRRIRGRLKPSYYAIREIDANYGPVILCDEITAWRKVVGVF